MDYELIFWLVCGMIALVAVGVIAILPKELRIDMDKYL